MHKLEYLLNGKVSESWHFPNKQLCNWKKNQLQNTHKAGKFKITKINKA